MRKTRFTYFALAVALLCGCKGVDMSREAGYAEVSIALESNPVVREIVAMTKASGPDLNDFTITFSGEKYSETFEYSSLPKSITVPCGTYEILAQNITEQQAVSVPDEWGSVRYACEMTLNLQSTVKPYQVNLIASMANAAVSVSIDDSFTNRFALDHVTVETASRQLEYNDLNLSSVGYFPAGRVLAVIYATSKETGEEATANIEMTLDPATHTTVVLKANTYIGELSSPVIVVDTTCESVYEEITVDPTKTYPVEVSVSSADDGTKVAVRENGKMYWETGDALAVRAEGASGKYGCGTVTLNKLDAGLGTARFKGEVEIAEAPTMCFFAYPADTDILPGGKFVADFTSQDGSLSHILAGACAYNANGFTCKIKPLCAIISLSLDSSVSKVTFIANGGEKVSGGVFDMKTGGFSTAEDAVSSYSLPGAELTSILLPPVVLSKGFTLLLEKADGSRMYRSFSSDGTADGGYSFAAGEVLKLDLTGFTAFSTPAVLDDVTHIFVQDPNDNTKSKLKDTRVRITVSKTGVPAKIIENWGAELYNSSGVLVRSFTADGIESLDTKVQMTSQNGWTYLPSGDYDLKTYVSVFGEKMYGYSRTVHSDAAAVSLTSDAYCSYDMYLGGNIQEANNCDNSTVYNAAVCLNVDESILSGANYAGIYNISATYDGGNAKSENGGAAEISYGLLAGQSWGVHTLSASGSFDGQTLTVSRTFHITGLPYKGNPPTSADWSLDSGNNDDLSFDDSGMKLGDNGTHTGSSSAKFNKSFHLPADINTTVSVDYGVKTAQAVFYFPTTITITVNGSEIVKQESESNSTNMVNGSKTVDMVFAEGGQTNIIVKNDASSSARYSLVKKFNILYR